MNLSEKLAAADGTATPPPPPEETPPPRNRRAGDVGGPPAVERRVAGSGPAPGAKAHPMRRASDRTALDEAWKQSKQKVQAKVLAEIAPKAADLSPDELREKVRSSVNDILEREDIGISPIERQRFVEEMLEDALGYGPLEALLADGSITEIMCNAFDEIWIERQGKLSRSDVVFNSPHQYRRIIDRMVHGVGRRVDESSPMVDARLADGSRINAIVPPLALRGPVLTVRKFPERALVMQDLIGLGSLSMDAAVFLEALVRGKISLIVVGGTGTGKTTMLNVLSNYIPDGERLITIEESAELQIQGEHVVTLETRPANAEGSGEVRIRDLVRNSLRMRPDRIIVGECRGAETLDMLQAMNTGHAGSMTTVHANTPRELLGRLETMVMMGGVELPQRAIREQIVMAIGCLVQLQRTPAGPRVVHSITEIQGMEGDTVLLQDIFHRVDMQEGFGRLVPTGLRPKILDELLAQRGRGAGSSLPQRQRPAVELGWSARRPPSPSGASGTGGRAALGGALRDVGASAGREVSSVTLAALQMGTQAGAFAAAVLVGGGLALAVVAMIMRVRTKQRTLAQILDDTMGTAEVPVEVVTESPEHGELSALTVRIAGIFGRIDTSGALERRLERASIPLRAGEYLVISSAIALGMAVMVGVITGSPIGSIVAVAVVAGVAWYLPNRRAGKRIKQIQEQLPDALALMSASVEGGQTFQRAIDMYRRDAKPPLSAELDRVMAEVAVGSDLVVALENMAERSGVEDLKWAVEAVRIQQSTGGRLAPILHTLADFMRTRQEVRREVQTLSAEGRMSGYVLFAIPIFLVCALELKDPTYLQPMEHGVGLVVLIGTAGLMALGFWIVRRMVNIEV